MWQKCPICDGSGMIPITLSINSMEKCKACNGTGIISGLTGLPPAKSENPLLYNQDNTEEQFKQDNND